MKCSIAASLCLLTATASLLRAVDPGDVDAARKLFTEKQSAVVAVSAVVKLQISVGGQNQSQEQSVEMLGTVINEQGLTLVAYSALDLSSQVKAQVKGKIPANVKLEVKSDFKEVKLILSDGEEVPGDVVLKDEDLDVAFIRPDPASDEFKAAKWSPVRLIPPPAEPQVLDEVVILERFGKDLGRKASVNFARIVTILTKPRNFYVVNDNNAGTPVYDLKGNLLGIFVRRIFEKSAATPVIMPVKDLVDLAKQAETAPAPKKEETEEKKPEAATAKPGTEPEPKKDE